MGAHLPVAPKEMEVDRMANTHQVRNPFTGEMDYILRSAPADEVKASIARLRAGQPAWAALGVKKRIDVLKLWASALKDRESEIIAALSADTGRRAIAKSEVDGVIASIDRWATVAEAVLKPASKPASAFPDVEIITDGDPFPVVGAISPWNFPILLSFVDSTPALLAGSAVYIKPSEVTPRFAKPVAEAIEATPHLRDILHIEPGDGATGAALVENVDVVAFTGSVATGRKVAAAAAKAFIPAFLELGGKDPSIVLAGADIDRATTAILRASVVATGQACQSLERLYVSEEIFDDFVEALVAKARATTLTIDDPDSGIIGPLIFEKQAEIIAEHIADARSKGANILSGGEIRRDGGVWIAPTIVTNVNHTMRLLSEETFGPVMPVMPFKTIDEAVALANDTRYGLSASVFAASVEEALAVGRRIDAGGVSINDAGLTSFIFDGEKSAYKQSGMGPSRMGPSGVTRFLRRKSYYINRGDVMPIHIFGERP
ncbi:MAG: aldehyde dehydrogenase family protein [Pseudomonadota bacterium]